MVDRLVELIMTSKTPLISRPIAKTIAENLIENGVIVPPCKVGDVVYELITIKDKSTKKINGHIVSRVVTSVHLSNRYSDKDKPYITLSAETFYKNGAYIKRVPIEAFGVTIFGTEREAEQALKGGADNG